MTHWQVLLVSVFAWATWVPAVVLQKAANDDKGAVSILPIFPILPLAVWGVAFLAGRYGAQWVPTGLGLAHGALLLALLFNIARSAWVLRQQRKARNGE